MMDYRRFGMPEFDTSPRRDNFLAVLTGVLLALSFPLPGLSLLAWIAFIPLLLACSRRTPRRAFRLGFTAGLVGYGGILYWINIVVTAYGHLPWPVSVLLYLGLSAYLALYPASTLYLVRRGDGRGISPLVSFPLLWVGFEYVRGFLLTGFPWAALGYSQYRMLPLIQTADLFGVYGVSFLIALSNVVIYRIIRGAVVKDTLRYPVKSGFVFLLLLAASLAYGWRQLHGAEEGRPLKVALIQGNINQDIKWNPAFQEATVSIYERLSRQACTSGADLVVWPESAAPFFFQEEPTYAERIKGVARATRSCVIFGSPAFEKSENRTHYLNSAFLLSPTGETLGRSDKIHLVPFGEYVPMANFLPFVNKMVAGIGDFSPGANITALNTGKGEVGILVCFEGIFPELARGYVRAGSQLLVNITNDAWFGRSSAPYQHLSMTVFRAVENRVPLVRAANTGISAIIDAKGRITGQTQIFTETFLNGEVRLAQGKPGSFYTRHGDLFAWFCTFATAVIAVIAFARKPRGVFSRKP